MTDYSKISILLNGLIKQIDLNTNGNALLVRELKINDSSGTNTKLLSHTLLSALVTAAADGGFATVNSLSNYAPTSLIGTLNATPTNYTPTAATVSGHLSGIDTAMVGAGGYLVKVSATDTTANYLDPSIIAGAGLSKSITNPSGNEVLDLAVNVDNVSIEINADTLRVKDLGVTTAKINDAAVTDVKVASGINATKIGSGTISNTKFGYLSGVTSDIQTQIDSKVSKSGSSMDSAANIVFSGGGQVLGLPATPTVDGAAASKAYVDAKILGLSPKKSVRVATTGNITIASALGAGSVIDGVTLASGDRVLVKNQTTASQNGIYVAGATPARSTDFDEVAPIDEINGAWVSIQAGTVNSYRVYVQYGTVTTVGTDAINFEFYNPLASITGGDMISVSGSNVSIDLSSSGGLESTNPGDPAGQLRVKMDGSTLASSSSGLKVNTNGITATEINANAVTTIKILDANVTTAKIADANITTIKIADSNVTTAKINDAAVTTVKILDANVTTAKIADSNVTTAKINDAAVTEAKLAASVAGAGLTGGAGSPIAVGANADGSITVNADDVQVAYSPATRLILVAGEGLSANITYFVRWAVTGETAGRVYKADKDASSSDKFYAFGTVRSGSAVSAGNSVTVNIAGTINLGSGDTNFASSDVGKAIYLTAAGAFSVTAPLTANEAVFRVGIVQDVSKIYLGQYQLNYIN
jgi:hypothetical protein